jgi:hypothetical protein
MLKTNLSKLMKKSVLKKGHLKAIPRKISPEFFMPTTPKADTLLDHYGGHS